MPPATRATTTEGDADASAEQAEPRSIQSGLNLDTAVQAAVARAFEQQTAGMVAQVMAEWSILKVALLGSGYLNLSLSERPCMCSVGAGLGWGEWRGCVGLSGCSPVCARCSPRLVFTPFRGGIHT